MGIYIPKMSTNRVKKDRFNLDRIGAGDAYAAGFYMAIAKIGR